MIFKRKRVFSTHIENICLEKEKANLRLDSKQTICGIKEAEKTIVYDGGFDCLHNRLLCKIARGACHRRLCPLRTKSANASACIFLCLRSAPKGGSTRKACGCFSKNSQNPLSYTTKKAHLAMCFFVVERGGFEPPKSLTTDLQSAPFGHSGTSPLELVIGIEPTTY